MHNLWTRIRRQWVKWRLRPIRVFCFHQVSDVFDPERMWECDWIQTERFKELVSDFLRHHAFISLEDAVRHLRKDFIRRSNYCVLTFDDGCSSVLDIMPWLAEKDIPVTLFVNPAFLAGEGQREKPMKLMSESDLLFLLERYGSLITVANHSYCHTLSTSLSADEFKRDFEKAEKYLGRFNGKIPFFAYPCDRHSLQTDSCLKHQGLVPVYCDGAKNYRFDSVIHREEMH